MVYTATREGIKVILHYLKAIGAQKAGLPDVRLTWHELNKYMYKKFLNFRANWAQAEYHPYLERHPKMNRRARRKFIHKISNYK